MFTLVLDICRVHRQNSEKCSKYFGMLYQHYTVQEKYLDIAKSQKQFSAGDAFGYINQIADMFKRLHKNAIFIAEDRSVQSMLEFNSVEEIKVGK